MTAWRQHRLLLGVIVLVILLALPTLLYPLGRDQGMYANIGAAILRGGTPYIEMWDIKPPPIYYIYAAGMALFGQTPIGVRAIDLVLVPVGMIGLAVLGTRLGGRWVGVWSALLYGVFYFSDQFANLSQSDSLVTVLMIYAALAGYLAAAQSPGTWQALRWSALCGALCGVTVWFKQYQLLFVAALILWQVWQRRQAWRALFSEAVAFSVGGLLTGGGLLLYFASAGILNEMLIVAQSTSAYNAQYSDWCAFFNQMGNYLGFRWLYWGPLFVLTGLAAVLMLFRRFCCAGWGLVWLWLMGATAFMVIQRLGFDTHWFPMLPPMALLAGRVLVWIEGAAVKAITRWRQGVGETTASPVTAIFAVFFAGILAYNTWLPALPYMTGRATQAEYFAQFQANDLKPEQSLAVVEWLRDRVVPGDSLYVWGFRPEVAFMGGWRPPTRWQAHFPLVASWYPPEWPQQNVDILWAAMPPYALILRDDYMPWVTGRSDDSNTILQDYTELNNWLIANYDYIDTLGDFLIWQRKPRTS